MTTTFEFDPDDLSVGELVDLTDFAGEDAIADLTDFAAGKPNPKLHPKMLLALVWILGRRTDPAFTLEDARAVKVIELKLEERKATAKAAGRKAAGKKHEAPPALVVAS